MNVDITMFSPNCTIWLGAARNIDPTYSHVFAIDKGEEDTVLNQIVTDTARFGDFVKHEKCLPVVDEREGYIRFPVAKALGVMSANYIIWKNQDVSGIIPKYAFILDIKYVNPHTVAIRAELDIFRTYLSQIVFRPAIMERSHWYQGADEKIGDNLYKEPISEAPNIIRLESTFEEFDDYSLILYKTPKVSGTTIPVREYGRVVTQFIAEAFKSPFDFGVIAESLSSASGHVQSFVAVPSFMVWEGVAYPVIKEKPVNYPKDIDGYVPVNKKLFTYPYIYREVDSSNGEKMIFRWELCDSNPTEGAPVMFKLVGLSTPQDNKIWYYPSYYEGSLQGNIPPNLGVNTHVMRFSSFVELPVSSDAWNASVNTGSLASLLSPLYSGLAGSFNQSIGSYSAGTGVEGMLTADPTVVASSTLNFGSLISGEVAAITAFSRLRDTPPSISGGSSVGLADLLVGNIPFTVSDVKVPRAYAEAVDRFFSVYGYRDPNLRTVNPKLRPHWCYWKSTSVCAFASQTATPDSAEGVPYYALDTINRALMKGVTFWNIDDDLGDYKDFKANHA